MDDASIIELFFARDQTAIKHTEEKYGKLCHSIAYNILGNAEDSEECVNDTYMGIWNAIPPTRPSNLMAFVCRIARNISLKKLEAATREKRSHPAFVSLSELAEILPDESLGQSVSDARIGELISDFLRREKEDRRNVFIRRYYFFESLGGIAKQFGYSESKIKSMLYRTRQKLKDYLIKEGVEL